MQSRFSVKEELEIANKELKVRRRYRLQQLYNYESRLFEKQLADLGLAVRRKHN